MVEYTILLVEDDIIWSDCIAELLGRETDIRVIKIVGTRREALEFLYNNHVDVKKEVRAQGTTCETVTQWVCGATMMTVGTTICTILGFVSFGAAFWGCEVVTFVIEQITCNWVQDTVCNSTPEPYCESPYLWSESEGMCTYWGI